jgi:hypothetical protein
MSPEQRLIRYVSFAHAGLRNSRIKDLPSLVRLYYRWNPVHPGAGDVLRWGSDYRGGCGSRTRVVVAMLRSVNVQSRPLLHLNNAGQSVHTVVEAKIEGRWVVADAYYGIVFRRRDGALATAADMQRDPSAFLAQVEHVPGYDIDKYNFIPVTRLNWNKIPVVLPLIRGVLARLLGESKVNDLARPNIWMWPQEIYSLLCMLLASAFGLLAVYLRKKSPLPRSRRSGSPDGHSESSLTQYGAQSRSCRGRSSST